MQHRKGLALLGWWLTGIPKYLLAAVLAIGSVLGWPGAEWSAVIGANRWVISVTACAALLADECPPYASKLATSSQLTTG